MNFQATLFNFILTTMNECVGHLKKRLETKTTLVYSIFFVKTLLFLFFMKRFVLYDVQKILHPACRTCRQKGTGPKVIFFEKKAPLFADAQNQTIRINKWEDHLWVGLIPIRPSLATWWEHSLPQSIVYRKPWYTVKH